MATTDTAFTGQIPQLYDRLMGPMLFQPYAADMARRLGDLTSGHVLETAAGTGIVTRALAAALPASVAITATDLNQPMLDHAASRSASQPGSARITWRQADAQKLPFADAMFDAVLCQFGVMFFPDKPAAYAEALRVLKPGGNFLFNVWNALPTSPIAATVHAAVAACFPADPPLFFPRTPHGHHDIPTITAALAAAGFTDIAAETRVETCRAASAAAAATALCQGTPLRGEILARDPTGLDRVTEAARLALIQRFAPPASDAPIAAPMEAIILTAARPA